MAKSVKALFVLSAIAITAFIPSAFAQEETTTSDEKTTSKVTASPSTKPGRGAPPIKLRIQTAKERNLEIRDNIKERASAAAEKRQEKLSEARLKICEARQKNIANRIRNTYARANNIHKAHERMYSLTDKFYTQKLVPNGYTLSNYADLKADIDANKANVAALIESAKTSGGEFDCSSEDPKGQADAFHEDMKALVEANKEYKTSIKNFIQAVRDLAKTAKIEKVSGTPTPAESGGVE